MCVVCVWCLYLKIPPPPGTSGDSGEEVVSNLIIPSSNTPLISMPPCHGRARVKRDLLLGMHKCQKRPTVEEEIVRKKRHTHAHI